MAPDLLMLPAEIAEKITDHLREELPNEGVGLLAVTVENHDGQRVALAEVFFPGRNRRKSPTRFDLDLRDLVTALATIEDNGWQLGAIVHSHPLGPPTPSRTDLAEANYPEALMMIVSFATSIPEPRASQPCLFRRCLDTQKRCLFNPLGRVTIAGWSHNRE